MHTHTNTLTHTHTMMQASRTRRDTHFLLHADIHTRTPDCRARRESQQITCDGTLQSQRRVMKKKERKKKMEKKVKKIIIIKCGEEE